jgi:hypothetical protein
LGILPESRQRSNCGWPPQALGRDAQATLAIANLIR